MTETSITVPFAPQTTWAIIACLGILLGTLLIYAILTLRSDTPTHADPLEKLKAALGVEGWNSGLVTAGLLLWCLVFAFLVFGLLSVLWSVLFEFSDAAPRDADIDDKWNFRFALAQLAAVTAVLGAVIGLPITVRRLAYTRQQTELADATLFNEKINAATEDLYAMRQVSPDRDPSKTIWEDDVARRNAGIDRLEGLVEEQPEVVTRVSRLLCVYVRELSRTIVAQEPPDAASGVSIKDWARGLTARSDMENAVQVLGRLKRDYSAAHEVTQDLRGANLQGMDFARGDFSNARLGEAHLQGANLFRCTLKRINLIRAKLDGANLQWADFEGAHLMQTSLRQANMLEAEMKGAHLFYAKLQGADLTEAQLQGADLRWAQLQGANLRWAQLQGADLTVAQLQGADLRWAELQGADLEGAKFDENTNLTYATLRGASVKFGDDTFLAYFKDHWQDVFTDGVDQMPEGDYPDHWAREELDWPKFNTQWRDWQRSIGQDPDTPQ